MGAGAATLSASFMPLLMRGAAAHAQLEAAKEAQLAQLLEHGFSAAEVAQYCDGTTPVDELIEVIRADETALDHHEDLEAEAGGSPEAIGGRGGSNFCIVA